MLAATEEQTQEIARQFAHSLQPGDVVALHGELGAGKTSFIKGIVRELSPNHFVQSPTFVYLHIYEGKIVIYHFDLYRLENAQDFLHKGFFDYLSTKEAICLIEWPERITSLLPKKTKHIQLEYTEENKGRKIYVA